MGQGAWLWHMKKNGNGRTPHWFIIFNRQYNAYSVVHTFDGEKMYVHQSPTPYGSFDNAEHVVCWYIGRFEWSTKLEGAYFLCDRHLELDVRDTLTTGWLSPQGVLYACGGEGHSWLASALVARFHPNRWKNEYHERALEEEGWIRLAYAHAWFRPKDENAPLTIEQIEAIEAMKSDDSRFELAESLRRLARTHKRQYERTDTERVSREQV